MKEKLFFGLLAFGLIGFVAFSTHETYARPEGVTGFSQGSSCNTCHSGGQSPDVMLEGPAVLFPNQTGSYALVISGGQAEKFPFSAAGGFNVAVSEGVLAILANATDVQLLNEELTHTAPKPIDGDGEVRFEFQYTAPMTPTSTVTMYGAGNSVNGMDGAEGDAASLDELMITVQEPTDFLYLPFVLMAPSQ